MIIQALIQMEKIETKRNDVAVTTDLERRVLAQERILHSLIAYMSKSEPRFINHLKESFVDPMSMVAHEHDYKDADDYAEEFIRAIMRGRADPSPRRARNERAAAPETRIDRTERMQAGAPATAAHRVRVKERSGIWEVQVDGVFRGDYRSEDQALAAAALEKLSL